MITETIKKIVPSKKLPFDEAFTRLRTYVFDARNRNARIQELQADLEQLMSLRGDDIAEGDEDAIGKVSALETELTLLRRAETLSHARAREAAVVVGNRAGEIERECRQLMQRNIEAANKAVAAEIAPWFPKEQIPTVLAHATIPAEAARARDTGCPSAVGITADGDPLHPDVHPADVLAAYDGVRMALERAKQHAELIASI